MKQKSSVDTEQTQIDKLCQGIVKLDLDDVYVPGYGSFHVKTEFPRLKPKFERERVDNCILEELSAELLAWVNKHFETTGHETYFKQLVFSTVIFCLYIDPQLEIYTEEAAQIFRITFLLWFNDDVIEKAIRDKIDFKLLKLGMDQAQSIFTGKYDNNPRPEFEDVPNYPIFRNSFYSLLEWHNIGRRILPEYDNQIKNFAKNLKSYYTALRWFCVDRIDGRYSEESFKTFRKCVGFSHGVVNYLALIHGVKLTDEIYNSLTMERLLEIVKGVGAYTNDILGMKKEFANGEPDNLIVFMVLEKKIPLQVAVQQICDLIASELADYAQLKQAIQQEFDDDHNLIRYLDILDSTLDGHNFFYNECSRYLAVGSVSLTR